MSIKLPFTFAPSGGGYAVRDKLKRVVAYVYGRQSQESAIAANVLTMPEAEQMARAICKITPEQMES